MKIIFFDIDGTLVSERTHEMLPSTKEAIRLARANGHLCIVNTGRTKCIVTGSVDKMAEFDGFLYGCGTRVEYRGQVLHEETYSPEDSRRIVEGLRRHGIDAILEGTEHDYHDGLSHMNTRVFYEYVARHQQYLTELRYEEAVGKFDKFFCYAEDPRRMEAFRRELGARITFIDRERGFFEAVPAGCSKASGMLRLVEKLGLSMEDTAAVGDSSNDLDMLECARIGIAMGNSVDAVKNIADYVTADVDEDGIWEALRWLGVV